MLLSRNGVDFTLFESPSIALFSPTGGSCEDERHSLKSASVSVSVSVPSICLSHKIVLAIVLIVAAVHGNAACRGSFN